MEISISKNLCGHYTCIDHVLICLHNASYPTRLEAFKSTFLQVHSGGIISFRQPFQNVKRSSSVSLLQGQENATAGIVYIREVNNDSSLLVKLRNQLQGLLSMRTFRLRSMIIVTWVYIQQNSTEMVCHRVSLGAVLSSQSPILFTSRVAPFKRSWQLMDKRPLS